MVEANPPVEQQPDSIEVEGEESKEESALRDNIKRKGANSVSYYC